MPNAIDILTRDHKQVLKVLGQLEQATASGERSDLLAQIVCALQEHSEAEEQVFYPAFRRADPDDGSALYYQALEEHALADTALDDLRRTDPRSEKFSARAHVLRQLIERHAGWEEQVLFSKSRTLFDGSRLAALGQRIVDLREAGVQRRTQRRVKRRTTRRQARRDALCENPRVGLPSWTCCCSVLR